MKKGLLLIGILLFIAGGVAVAYGLDRISSAGQWHRSMDKVMAKVHQEKDMAKMEAVSEDLKMFAEYAAKAKQSAWMGFGGGAVLLVAGIILMIKSRSPRSAV